MWLIPLSPHKASLDLLRDKDFQLRNSKSPKELSGFFNISVRYNRKPFDFFDLQTFFTLSRNRFNERIAAPYLFS